ncbi:MAG: PHP domain-containing protein [Clostridiaceae bacterium]|nr:PHP domain-containing protein [Clostridiaceae bacterium]
MKYADLHIHSSYSDGTKSPEEIVKYARENGVKYISITDHDNLDSQYITKATYDDIKIISGVEFSTSNKDLEFHLLAYSLDVENKILKEKVEKIKNVRKERNLEIIRKLKKIHIHINCQGKNNNIINGRRNIAKEIVRQGYAANYKDAFNKYLSEGRPAYVSSSKPNCKELLEIINDSNGIAILAHPSKLYRSTEIEKVIKELKCYGLKGIEVYHPSHSNKQIVDYYNLSKKYKMLITGGSDFHEEKNGEITLGKYGIDKILLEKLLEYR